MDRGDLTLAVGGALMLAVLLGWLLALIARRLNACEPGGAAEIRELSTRLQAAEASRRSAEARLAQVEADLRARLTEAEAERTAALSQADRERAHAEDVRAAYRAAMAGHDV